MKVLGVEEVTSCGEMRTKTNEVDWRASRRGRHRLVAFDAEKAVKKGARRAAGVHLSHLAQ
jgi:hypothetical protein